MSKTKSSMRLLGISFVLFIIGTMTEIPLDEFYYTDKIIETTDDMPKASGEWGKIQENTTNDVKNLYSLVKLFASIAGIISLVLATLYLYTQAIRRLTLQ